MLVLNRTMKTKLVVVTPEKAATFLEGNTHNRTLRDARVQQYARDMRNDVWHLTHQGIAFDTDGTLTDGQHRLWAVIESSKTIQINMTTGVPVGTQKVIDDHLQRNVVDALRLTTDMDVKSESVAIVTLLLRGFSGGRPTHMEVEAALHKFAPALEFTQECFRQKVRGISVSPVRLVVARAYYSSDLDALRMFAHTLVTGLKSPQISDVQHASAMLLRNHCMFRANRTSNRKPHMQFRRIDVYHRAQRALFAFLHGEKLTKLHPAIKELFPLPDTEHDALFQQTTRRLELQAQRTKAMKEDK
jgi:hypothetical protein